MGTLTASSQVLLLARSVFRSPGENLPPVVPVAVTTLRPVAVGGTAVVQANLMLTVELLLLLSDSLLCHFLFDGELTCV